VIKTTTPSSRAVFRLLWTTTAALLFSSGPLSAQDSDLDFFEMKVRPLLSEHCFKCHGPSRHESGLRLDSLKNLRQGGDGGRVIVERDLARSRLLIAVRYMDPDLKMPPDDPLLDSQVKTLEEWVRRGTPWPTASRPPTTGSDPIDYQQWRTSHWAWQPVQDYEPPPSRDRTGASSPIDRFINARLEDSQLTPVPAAGKRQWLRRVTFDLIGLPPTPEEVRAFLEDDSPDLHERVIDRLLASPHYGERWGRHWLDVVRYADTTANDGNFVMRYAYRFRNYVIDAFNGDMPYDQFIKEQIAGDLLPATRRGDVLRGHIATGFLMLGPKGLAEADKEQLRMDIVDEQIDVVGRAMLGVTLACARCHDHKFDPITTADYYSLAGIFRSLKVLNGNNGPTSMWHEGEVVTPAIDQLAESQAQRTDVMFPLEQTGQDLKIHVRGKWQTLSALAPRSTPHLFAGEEPQRIDTKQSGRLQLADWIASSDNPLTARVMVNRIWQYHFGRGLVATSDNFGQLGELPSHPELLDYLARRFLADGWSVKSMHRRILLSNVYRRATSGTISNAASGSDPENRLLSRFPRRRLEAEAIRDAILAVGGQLDRRYAGGGESIMDLFTGGEVVDKDLGLVSVANIYDSQGFDSLRRSIYLPVIRNGQAEIFNVFDAADPNAVTTRRNESTVTTQSMFMLNSPFVRQHSLHFARRLLRQNGLDRAARIEHAFQLAFGRPASQQELMDGEQFIVDYLAALDRSDADREAREQAWQSYCQILFCTNEFIYVE
jgi:hypothetical protein